MAASRKSIAVSPRKIARLRKYKSPSSTFDAALNRLMDSVPIEFVPDAELREARRRLGNFRGRDWRTIRKEMGNE